MDSRKMMQLAERIAAQGNVTAACAEAGIARSVYYRWLKGQGQASASKRRHPQAMSDKMIRTVLELAQRHPEWGCDRISHYLMLHKMIMSGTSIQKFLASRGLGKAEQRIARSSQTR